MLELKKTRTVTTTETLDLAQEHWWRVSTEGDVEGRTVRSLGLHHGTFLEVAERLSGSCSYVLEFEWVNPNDTDNHLHPGRSSVAVKLRAVSTTVLSRELRRLGDVDPPSGPNDHAVTVNFTKPA